jgi:hypothetical protein
MDPAQRRQLAFVLTLVGGLLSLMASLFYGALAMIMAPFLDYPSGAPAPPGWLVLGVFGFFAVASVAGGVTMLVFAPRLRRPPSETRGAAIGAIVGGSICFLVGNVVSAGLGIAGGVLALSDAEAGA